MGIIGQEQGEIGTQSLDFGGLGVRLLFGILGLNFTSDNKFSHIVLLRQIKELANFARSLGTKTFGVCDVGDAGNFNIALFDDDNGKDSKVRTDNAAADGLAFAFSRTAGAVAGVAFGEKKTDTGGM
jgi:hypothetical protein